MAIRTRDNNTRVRAPAEPYYTRIWLAIYPYSRPCSFMKRGFKRAAPVKDTHTYTYSTVKRVGEEPRAQTRPARGGCCESRDAPACLHAEVPFDITLSQHSFALHRKFSIGFRTSLRSRKVSKTRRSKRVSFSFFFSFCFSLWQAPFLPLPFREKSPNG